MNLDVWMPPQRFALLKTQTTTTRCLPCIQLRRGQHTDPKMSRRIVSDNLLKNVTSHRADTENSENFLGDDGWVRDSPSGICAGVFFPWLRRRRDMQLGWGETNGEESMRTKDGGRETNTYRAQQTVLRSYSPVFQTWRDRATSLQASSVKRVNTSNVCIYMHRIMSVYTSNSCQALKEKSYLSCRQSWEEGPWCQCRR
jgi:hypothetical protein